MKKLSFIITPLLATTAFAAQPTKVPPVNQVTFGIYSKDFTGTAHPIRKSTSVVDKGGILMWEHEVYQYGQHFSLNFGVSTAYYQRKGADLFDLAIYPALRFWLHRDMWFSPYLLLSVGPSAMSRSSFGPHDDFGSNFAFQDILGVCVRMGGQSAADACVKFQHYSNANLAMPNHGFDVPIVFSLGYDFS